MFFLHMNVVFEINTSVLKRYIIKKTFKAVSSLYFIYVDISFQVDHQFKVSLIKSPIFTSKKLKTFFVISLSAYSFYYYTKQNRAMLYKYGV